MELSEYHKFIREHNGNLHVAMANFKIPADARTEWLILFLFSELEKLKSKGKKKDVTK